MLSFYTCALRPFESNDYFFTRDSGLLCRNLQQLGVNSHVVLPQLDHPDEFPREDVIRASASQMRDPEWWRSLHIDAVAIVTWGFAQDTAVIQAVKDSGILLYLVVDDSCQDCGLVNQIKRSWRRLYHYDPTRRFVECLLKTLPLSLYFSWIYRGKSRYKQYGMAHYVRVWTPFAAERMKEGIKRLKGAHVNEPVFESGYPACSLYDDSEFITMTTDRMGGRML